MELVTKADKDKIEARLAALVNNRVAISKRINEAKELGDLKENGDYHAAREQQGMEEADIRRLQERLSNMSVIDERMSKAVEGVVFIGSMVQVREMVDEHTEKSRKNETIRLVGEFSGEDSDDYDEVTATSPMGEALLKSRVGEIVRYQSPRGVKMYKIMAIE